MSFRRAVEMTGTSILLFATAALIATGCSSGSSGGGSGGATGAGGHVTSTGGHTASGGATGAGGAGMGGSSVMPTCTALAASAGSPVILDFADMASFTFGDFNTTLSGTLISFNGATPAVTTGAWVIDQDVTGYGETGVGINFQPCPKADLSAFTGLSFDVAGVITPQMAGVDAGTIPAQHLSFTVSTAPDDVASNYDAQNQFAPSFGTCVPATNQYDGTCATPKADVTIAPGPTLVTKSFTWNQITGGRGQPNGRGTPDPAQITGIRWIFPYDGMVPFHIQLTIDNIRGLTAGGTTDSGTPPPPVDAATGG